MFYKIIILQPTTSCVIISLTCFNFLVVITCSPMTFNWLMKKAFFSISHNVVIFYFYFWKIISCVYFSVVFIFKLLNKKDYLLLENLLQLRNLNIVKAFDLYLFQLIVLLKPDFDCSSSFVLFWAEWEYYCNIFSLSASGVFPVVLILHLNDLEFAILSFALSL